MKNTLKHIILLFLTLFLCNCKEEIELETENFESVLVVEGTVTNEFSFQKIKLSRTYFLEENEPVLENNATVTVEDDNGNNFNFSQNTLGEYISDIKFEAIPNTFYTLFITTVDDKKYQSTQSELTPISQINNLYAEYNQSDDNVHVNVDSENETNGAQYFRYEYEETYKIVVPYYSTLNAIPTNVVGYGEAYDMEFELKTENQKICFTSKSSKKIIQTSTSQLENNTVYKFAVKEIDKDDSVLRERYSILVKQYVQNLEAYNYYKTIKELGINESILSENQPGFVIGNIMSTDDNPEKIIGFFEVASVSSQRIYFNYQDIGISKPNYFYDCQYRTDDEGVINLNPLHRKLDYNYIFNPDLSYNPSPATLRRQLYVALTAVEPDKYFSKLASVYEIVSPLCGDCTSFSSNIQPDFWVD